MHFIDENTQSPPINSLSVALVEDDFWGNVLRSTTDGEGSSLVQDLGKTKISQLKIPIIGNEQVLRLEIPENNVFGVEILKAWGDRGTIEPGLVGGEGFHWPEVGKELSSVDELEDQIEVLGVLGEALEVDDEGVADLGVDEVFIIDVVDLLGLDDLAFVEQFERDVLSGLFVLGHFNLAEPTLTEDSTDLVVL